MASRNMHRDLGSLTKGVVSLYGRVLLGASGAISTATLPITQGFTIVKTAAKTGRYTVTLQDRYFSLLGVNVTILGATDAAYTTAKGQWNGLVRNNLVSTSKTLDLQMQRTDTGADAEVEDNLTLFIELKLTLTSLFKRGVT